MSEPILIWTFRRTGGTTLTELLLNRSEHPVVDQEPFNWDRCFGAVAKHWHDGQDKPQLLRDLTEVLRDHPTIKHCYELHNDAFNAALFGVASELGYRHMILDRDDEVSRILSLELAKLTGAWGKMGSKERYRLFETGEKTLGPIDIPTAVSHMKQCAARRRNLDKLIAASGQQVRRVLFEDIYKDPEAGRAMFHAILADFGLDAPGDEALEKQITIALLHRGQNSARMFGAVPNIDAARSRLTSVRAKLQAAA